MLLLDCYIVKSFILEWFVVTVASFHNCLCVNQVFIRKNDRYSCIPGPLTSLSIGMDPLHL